MFGIKESDTFALVAVLLSISHSQHLSVAATVAVPFISFVCLCIFPFDSISTHYFSRSIHRFSLHLCTQNGSMCLYIFLSLWHLTNLQLPRGRFLIISSKEIPIGMISPDTFVQVKSTVIWRIFKYHSVSRMAIYFIRSSLRIRIVIIKASDSFRIEIYFGFSIDFNFIIIA